MPQLAEVLQDGVQLASEVSLLMERGGGPQDKAEVCSPLDEDVVGLMENEKQRLNVTPWPQGLSLR